MEQKIIIRKENHYTPSEDQESVNKLKLDYHNMWFGSYPEWMKCFHINIGGFRGLDIYIEMSPYEAEKLFLELAEKARNIR